MHESPSVSCEKCGSPSKKMVSACGILVHNTHARGRVMSHISRTNDSRQDLAENFGVENVTPVGGNTMSDVYNDVKRRGLEVREQMQKKREDSENARVRKAKEWRRAGMRRAPERTKVYLDKKAKEKAAKRAITL